MSYEQLRNCEKNLIRGGHSEKLFTRGRIYGRLIKVFATRPSNSQQNRRPSLQETMDQFRRRPSINQDNSGDR